MVDWDAIFTIYSCAYFISSLISRKAENRDWGCLYFSLSTAKAEKLEIHESPVFACRGRRIKTHDSPAAKLKDLSFIGCPAYLTYVNLQIPFGCNEFFVRMRARRGAVHRILWVVRTAKKYVYHCTGGAPSWPLGAWRTPTAISAPPFFGMRPLGAPRQSAV